MKRVKRTVILVGLLSLVFASPSLRGKEKNSLKYWCKQGKGLALTSASLLGTLYYGNGLMKALRSDSLFRCNALRLGTKFLLSTYGLMWGIEMMYDSSLMKRLKTAFSETSFF